MAANRHAWLASWLSSLQLELDVPLPDGVGPSGGIAAFSSAAGSLIDNLGYVVYTDTQHCRVRGTPTDSEQPNTPEDGWTRHGAWPMHATRKRMC